MPTESTVQLLHDHFDALGRALADTLNHRQIHDGGWTHQAHRNTFGSLTLTHPGGLGFTLIHLHSYRAKGAGRRLTIEGVYPGGFCGHRTPSITVGMDQPPMSMVNQIVRRLLPDYVTTHQVAVDDARTQERQRLARVAVNRRMERVLPGLSPAGGPSATQTDRVYSYWSGARFTQDLVPALASGHVRLSSDASTASLRLDGVPADVVLAILELINPSRPVEGVIAPRALAPERASLPPADRTIVGEVLR
ncbi:hypothetical protein QMK19_38625 [Streptomyces sp. H10-C2]|uniref:hypothetical protein n=1 Tax=unclassified Streptomyces TaxID=2593676 RepID=UPI0024BBBA6F|nr:MULTISPECIES: hypothetical protein [unclassified Streptomyces]MDJ0346820.1 hypothetical protein [Streptomyces sp. PH10-H1]MDJ0375355.1 hypothetical protein [Streptomyces sp. H10-C2]